MRWSRQSCIVGDGRSGTVGGDIAEVAIGGSLNRYAVGGYIGVKIFIAYKAYCNSCAVGLGESAPIAARRHSECRCGGHSHANGC